MKFLRAFNREQLTLAAALILALLLLTSMFGGGAVAAPRQLRPVERTYTGPPASAAEYVTDKFPLYWEGRDIFQAVVVDKLQVPDIKPPTPRPEALVLPPLRPGPAFDSLNRSGVPVKYRPVVAGAPSVQATDLPADPELAELKSLAEPEVPFVPDRRMEKTREHDLIHLTNNRPPLEGRIIVKTAKGVTFKGKDGTTGGEIPWLDIAKDKKGEPWIEHGWTHEQEYKFRAEKVKSGDVAGRIELAQWCRDVGMVAEAKQEYRAAIEALRARGDFQKVFFEAVAQAGDLMRETADFDGAAALYSDVMKWTPFERAEMAGRLGDAMRSIGILEGALAAYRASLDASPRYTRGRAMLARTLLELGRDAEALSTVAELFAKYGDTVKPAERVDANAAKGLALLRSGDLRGALEAFQEILKQDARNAEAINAVGVIHVLNGQVKEGAAQFVAAIRANQYAGDAWLNLGGLCLAAGKVAEAEGLFAAAVQRDPASAEAVVGQAVALVLKNQAKDAVPRLDEALKLDPRHFYAHYVRGHLKLQEGAHADALTGFASALQSEFHFLPAYSGAAMAYMASARALETAAGAAAEQAANREGAAKQRVNAETLLSTIRDFDPNRASTYVGLGCVLAVQGRGPEAERAFQRALELNQAADPLLAYGRGYVAYWQSDGDAKQRLTTAWAIFNQGSQMQVTDPIDKEWVAQCVEIARQIGDWQLTSVYMSKDVGWRWIQKDKQHGVKIELSSGRGRWSGKQTVANMGLTLLEREVPKQDFLSFEVTLGPESGKFEFGVSLYFTEQAPGQWMGLHVGVDMNGKLRHVSAGSKEFETSRLDYTGTEVQKFELPNPREVQLRFVRRSEQRGAYVFDVLVYSPAKKDWLQVLKGLPVLGGGATPSYKVSVWGRALVGQEYAFTMDGARVLLKRQQ